MRSLSATPVFRNAEALAHALCFDNPRLQSHLDKVGTVEVGGWRFRLRKDPMQKNIDIEILRPRSLLRCIWFLFSRHACIATRDAIRCRVALRRDGDRGWCASSPVVRLAVRGVWRGARMRDMALLCPSFRQADLREARLEGVSLHKAIFRDVDLRGAELIGVDCLAWCDFRGVDLSLATIRLSGDYGAPLRYYRGIAQQDVDGCYRSAVIGLLKTLDTIDQMPARHALAAQLADRLIQHAEAIRQTISPLERHKNWQAVREFAVRNPGAFGPSEEPLLNALQPPDLLDVEPGIAMTPPTALAILRLRLPVTAVQIGKAYRSLARKEHSDKGGRDSRMAVLNAARETALKLATP